MKHFEEFIGLNTEFLSNLNKMQSQENVNKKFKTIDSSILQIPDGIHLHESQD
jgi:hypothetical protein